MKLMYTELFRQANRKAFLSVFIFFDGFCTDDPGDVPIISSDKLSITLPPLNKIWLTKS